MHCKSVDSLAREPVCVVRMRCRTEVVCVREYPQLVFHAQLRRAPNNALTSTRCRHLTIPCIRRLYAIGIITTKKSLVQLEKLSTSALCRRRLAVVMVRLKMAETLKEACTLIEQVGQHPLLTQCAKLLQGLIAHST